MKKHKKIIVKCNVCGKETTNKKYCSRKCQTVGSHELLKRQIVCICGICKKEFNVSQSVVNSGNGKFCSKNCYGKYLENHYKGNGNPMYGKTQTEHTKQKRKLNRSQYWDEKYSNVKFEFLPKNRQKNIILEEQSCKCNMCGISEWNGKKIVLQLDHIDGIRHNNMRKNLRCLCPNCHSQTETWGSSKQYVNKGLK